MASRKAERQDSVTRGTGNVFADLGFPDAAERQAKLRLAYALNQVLEARKLSQADAAKVLGVTQPKVSALRHYKLAGFSLERLMNLLMALDQDVEIVIRRKPRSRKAGRIRAPAGSFNGSIERDAADDLHVSVERPPPHPSEGNRAPRGRQIRPSPPSNRLCATSDRIRLTRNQHRGSKAVSARSFKRHLTRHWSKW